jgi:flagellar export protein FliJ
VSASKQLRSVLRVKAAAERTAMIELGAARAALAAGEAELAAAASRTEAEAEAVARVLERPALDLAAHELARRGLDAVVRREAAVARTVQTLAAALDARQKTFESARAERRAVEELMERRSQEDAVEARRAETRQQDELVRRGSPS